MHTWTKGPFGEDPCYAGLRLRAGKLEELDDEQVRVGIPMGQVKHLRLEHGIAAERPTIQLVLGGAMMLAGLWGAAAFWRLPMGRRSVFVLAATLCLAAVGLAVALTGRRRCFYLALDLGSDRRKLPFAATAEPRGLSIFIAQLEKRTGVQIAVPADFAARSRFATTLPEGLRTISRQVRGRAVRSFSLSARDDSLFDVLVEPLATWLASYLEDGAEVRDRQAIQFGTQLLLTELDGEYLRVLASAGAPDAWSVDLRDQLLASYRQREVARSFGIDPSPPSPFALVSVEVAAAAGGPVVLHRLEPADLSVGEHSGWYVAALRERGSDGEEPPTLHPNVLDLAELRPELDEYLALPPGFSVVVDPRGVEVKRGDETLAPAPGSYLHAKQQGLTLPGHLTGSA